MIRHVPVASCWAQVREDTTVKESSHRAWLRARDCPLLCASLSSPLSLASPFPSSLLWGLRLRAVPGLYPFSLLPSTSHLQLSQQGLPPIPPDFIQHVTDKLQSLSLSSLLSSNPGRFPLNSTTQLVPSFCILLVCLANSLSWQVHQEAIILLKPGA